MTGRELIIYILENNLENQKVCENGKILGLLTVSEAADKFDVGPATIRIWYEIHKLKGVTIGDEIYILANEERPDREVIDD